MALPALQRLTKDHNQKIVKGIMKYLPIVKHRECGNEITLVRRSDPSDETDRMSGYVLHCRYCRRDVVDSELDPPGPVCIIMERL